MGWLELLIGGAIGWFVIAPMVSPIVHQGINTLQGLAGSGYTKSSMTMTRHYGYPAFADFRGRGIDISGRSLNKRYSRMRSFPAVAVSGRPVHYQKMRSFN